MGIAITIIALLLITAGVIGAVIQVIPSGPCVGLGILIWAIYVGTPLGWTAFGISAFILVAAMVAKILIPGRQLTQSGIPNSTLIWGLVGAIVGYFLIPVVGFVVGLIAATYVVEFMRLSSHDAAWAGTRAALKAVGWSIAIELLAALLAASIWASTAIYIALATA